MNTKRCTNLDVKKLFEEHSIKEIVEKQKEIQLESDRKKIELRTLVGERYRDLIQAADTIREMKLTAEGVALKMIKLENEFQQLQKNYLIGFKIEPPADVYIKRVNGIPKSVIIQLKILSDIPEHIWTAIANKDLLFATQLFIVAQHINYSLIFEVGNEQLSEKYPIASKQWDVLNQFKHIIKDQCHKTLKSLNVSVEHVASCLASLVLLNGTTFTDLLQKLITTRNNVIGNIMKNEENQSVKRKIKMCIEALIQTMNLIHSCFKNHEKDNQGLVLQYLESIKDIDANVIINHLDVDQNLVEKFLPPITINHKPFSQGIEKDSSSTFFENSIKSWLQWVKEFCSSEIAKQLELIDSVKGLHKVRKEAVEIEIPPNWDNVWEDLSMPRLNIWTEFFQPLVTKRAKSIISGKWERAGKNLKSDLVESLTKLAHDKSEFSESDLRWYVWKDSPSDIPQKLSKNAGIDNKRSLLMKAKAYSTNIVKLCDNFDGSLHSLLMDLDQYLFEIERTTKKSVHHDLLSPNIIINFQLSSDRTEVQEHLQKTSTTYLEDVVEFIKTECNIEKPEYGTRDMNAIFIARLLSALTFLCPNLNRCFTLSKLSESIATNIKWQSICDNLKEQSILLWTTWADTYKNNIVEHRNQLMNKEQFDELKMHLVVSELEKVIIEEEAEEGKKIESEILVPYQPSMPLLKFLTAVNKDLNKIIPHTLPKKILHNIIEKIATEVFDYYLYILNNVNFKQKQAFQILFDLKYCTLLMVPREHKSLNEKSTEASDRVLSNIDPFDFDTFHPFIEINVKKSIQRSLLIFGNLIPHLEQLHSFLGARNENSTSEKSNPPAVLALCTGAPWFPPLTVTAPTRNVPLVTNMVPDKVQRKKTATKEHTRSDSASATIKSGAAAFFGAMGTDWFGTN